MYEYNMHSQLKKLKFEAYLTTYIKRKLYAVSGKIQK